MYVPSSELGLPQPLSRQRVCPSPPEPGGGGGRGRGSPNSDDWRKRLVLCLLCGRHRGSLSVGDPDPHVFGVPDPDPLVGGADPDPDQPPDPSLFS
jgi:hypothetical protein